MSSLIYSNVLAGAGNSLTPLTAAGNWYVETIELAVASLTTTADGTLNCIFNGDLVTFFQTYTSQTGAATAKNFAPRILRPKCVLLRGATIKFQTIVANVSGWVVELNLYGANLQ